MTNQEITIPNIDQTTSGLKYAYEKEGIFDTKYVAECNEYGEEFDTDFYAPSTYTNAQLKEIGNELAMTWGAVCIRVKKELK